MAEEKREIELEKERKKNFENLIDQMDDNEIIHDLLNVQLELSHALDMLGDGSYYLIKSVDLDFLIENCGKTPEDFDALISFEKRFEKIKARCEKK